MHRPDSIPDVLALVRRSRAVDDARLGDFLELLRDSGLTGATGGVRVGRGCRLTPAAILGLMVERGLLTPYQAGELVAGRGDFWVGGYLVLDLLGRGGMGHVFLAEHGLLRKRVALKVLSAGIPADEAVRERFVREARAAAALDHPNVVRVLDVNAAHDPPFLVLEYVDGVSLQAAVARHGTFADAEAAAVGAEIARGLHEVAAVGLVHRDIKPANVLIDRKGGVKILDLGIARFESDPVSVRLDRPKLLGTLDYLAPEQALDSSAVDPRADLYALGGTLYFLLAGHPPFPDDDLGRKIAQKQSADPAPLTRLRPDVPAGLAAIIHRLLARAPGDRYPTAAAAAAALAAWAAPGADFPARLFRPAGSVADLPGRPTACGEDDPCPTSLPPTRRLLRSQTERRVPAHGADTPADRPALPPEVAPEPNDPPPEFTPALNPDEDGSPTVTLLATRARKWHAGRKALWALFLLLAAAAGIGGTLCRW